MGMCNCKERIFYKFLLLGSQIISVKTELNVPDNSDLINIHNNISSNMIDGKKVNHFYIK